MSTQIIYYLLNAAIFVCIIGITLGILIFNWGNNVKIKQHQLKGIFVIIANALIIYLFCAPKSFEYKDKLFLEKEFSGVVIEKIIEKHNHNIPQVYIKEFQTQENIRVALDKNVYKKIEVGDTLSKSVNNSFVQIKNKNKDFTIPKDQLIFP